MPMPLRSILLAVLLAVLLGFLVPAAAAQEGVERPAPLVVMNLAAHPDDEDGLTLAAYRYAKDAAAYSVIYTRGEGGQNEIGPELYEALGAIRTAETIRAARYLGTEVRFLNFYDFGFSKHAAEAFEEWGGRDAVTARLVYLIRKLKPDVLFTNHDTLTVGERRQHGHHQAVGLSAFDAFALAADPSYHPEQLAEAGVEPWQPQRLFLRIRGSAQAADVRVPVGTAVPGLGGTPADLAVAAVAEHRSQGFDRLAPRFRADTTAFVLLREAPGAPPLPEGATDLAAGLAPNPHAAEASLAHLIAAGRIFPVSGLRASTEAAIPGQEVTIEWAPAEGRLELSGAVEASFEASAGVGTFRIPPEARPTLPKERAQYERFASHPPIQAALRRANGELLRAGHLPLEIAPPLVLSVEEAVAVPGFEVPPRVLLHPGANRLTVGGRLYERGDLHLAVEIVEGERVLASAGREVRLEAGPLSEALELELPPAISPGTYAVRVRGRLGEGAFLKEVEGVVLPEVAVPEGLRVGFVASYDDATEQALREMGIEVVPLEEAALASGDFGGLHTIVLDIRAYLVRPDLREHNERLLAWVREGGHLVVNYHKTFEWNPGQTSGGFFDEVVEVPEEGFAPYPLRLGRERVTYEDAPVTILTPEHVLFRRPNAIGEADWDGWVQERGLYFPAEFDGRYLELLAMSDPGEAPLTSSTLLAEVGAGTYLYTALGWYRQLAAYVPGAYRLFANLVSLPLVDGRADGAR